MMLDMENRGLMRAAYAWERRPDPSLGAIIELKYSTLPVSENMSGPLAAPWLSIISPPFPPPHPAPGNPPSLLPVFLQDYGSQKQVQPGTFPTFHRLYRLIHPQQRTSTFHIAHS